MAHGLYSWPAFAFSGRRLRNWLENPLSRIEPRELGVAFYLYPDLASAKSGRKVGGSGFWVGVESTKIKDFRWIYGVSNRHVVHCNGASVIRANSQDGRVIFLEKEPTDWIDHPDGHDIAILPLISGEVPGFSHVFVPIPMFATEKHIKDEVVGVGDDVYMIGRFINHEGTTRNTPSARFGNISMLPGEPIYIDAGTPPQTSFAVELRSTCGYSGSPVFVETGGARRIKGTGQTQITTAQDYLLGVHWGHIIEPWTVETRVRRKVKLGASTDDEEEVEEVSANTGMNGIVPVWFLLQLLNLSSLQTRRDQEEADEMKRIAREDRGAVLDSAHENPSVEPTSHVSDDEENPQHLADFKRLVDVAARKRPQGDQT